MMSLHEVLLRFDCPQCHRPLAQHATPTPDVYVHDACTIPLEEVTIRLLIAYDVGLNWMSDILTRTEE